MLDFEGKKIGFLSSTLIKSSKSNKKSGKACFSCEEQV